MWSAVREVGAIKLKVSSSGPRLRSVPMISEATASSARTVASTTTNERPRRNTGRSEIGGNWSSRPTDVTSSGTVSTHSRQAARTSAARSIGQNSTPA